MTALSDGQLQAAAQTDDAHRPLRHWVLFPQLAPSCLGAWHWPAASVVPPSRAQKPKGFASARQDRP